MGDTKRAWDMVDDAKSRIENLSVDEVEAAMAEGDATVVDIRDIRELLQLGKVPGAVHAPRGMLEFWVDPESEYYREVFSPEKRYILYCAGGGRSALAADTMRDMGYDNVGHMEAGFGGWAEAGKDVEDVASTSKWVRRQEEG